MGRVHDRKSHTWPTLAWLYAILALTYNILVSAEDSSNCVTNQGSTLFKCRHVGLETVPTNLPTSLIELDVSQNRITNLSSNAFYNLSHLLTLNLSFNALNSVSKDVLEPLTNNLQQLYLQNNNLTNLEWDRDLVKVDVNDTKTQGDATMQVLQNLTHLDLSHNSLRRIPEMQVNLESFKLSYNEIRNLPENWHIHQRQTYALLVLHLSHNKLTSLPSNAFANLPNLEQLFLNSNNISILKANTFSNLPNLTIIDLSQNPVFNIPSQAFTNLPRLLHLNLSLMSRLTYIHPQAFYNLDSLQVLDLSRNRLYSDVHAKLFKGLISLMDLDMSFCSISILYPETFQNLTHLQVLKLEANPIQCDCQMVWFKTWLAEEGNNVTLDNSTCNSPREEHQMPVTEASMNNMTCSPAIITNITENAWFPIGSSGVLDCTTQGTPAAEITWITPRGERLYYNPAYVIGGAPEPHHSLFHQKHNWHDISEYFYEIPPHKRLHLLKNGSLYIDYVQRWDGGPFKCIAHNIYGTETAIITVRLDYSSFLQATVTSAVVGGVSVFVFLGIGIIIAIIRYMAHKCSYEQRQKRKSIRAIVDALGDYKTSKLSNLRDYRQAKLDQLTAFKIDKVDQLAAYKTAKVDQLSTFKSDKIDKLRNYKNLTLGTIVTYTMRMRENYTQAVTRVKDNCQSQAERLRDNYGNQVGRFREHKIVNIEKIRDNYSNQVMRVRDYGLGQLERLREQYKTQQQHLMKLIEVLGITNCMTVIEAECMRTESLLFDPAFNLDLADHPVHVTLPTFSTDDEDDYDTASCKNYPTENPNMKDAQTSTSGSKTVYIIPTKYKHRKRKRRKTRRRLNSPATREPKEKEAIGDVASNKDCVDSVALPQVNIIMAEPGDNCLSTSQETLNEKQGDTCDTKLKTETSRRAKPPDNPEQTSQLQTASPTSSLQGINKDGLDEAVQAESPEQTAEQTVEKTAEKTAEQTTEQTAEQTVEQTTEQTAEQIVEQTAELNMPHKTCEDNEDTSQHIPLSTCDSLHDHHIVNLESQDTLETSPV